MRGLGVSVGLGFDGLGFGVVVGCIRCVGIGRWVIGAVDGGGWW
jgi:hypothetical protein